MALQELSGSNLFNLSKYEVLPDGETYACYPVQVIDVMIKNRPAKNIEVVNAETGETQVIPTSGNIKYRVNDGSLKMGIYTEFTRNGTAKYGNLPGAAFKIAQDEERTLDGANFTATSTPKTTSTKKSAADVKATAEKLRSQVG